MDQPPHDDKDWTWVLETPCPACGFEAMAFGREELGAKLRANAAEWRAVLSRGARVATRPPLESDEGGPVWSALEYGCHVRDVYKIFGERVTLMLKKGKKGKAAEFKNWNPNVTAEKENYGAQDPDRVAYELASEAGKTADIFDRVSDDEWQYTGLRSDGSSFTIESIGRYLLHDPVHHLHDVEQGFEALA